MDHSRSDTHLESTPVPPVDSGGFAPGTVVADRYRIIAMLGRGGMGEVYRADDLRLNQQVALKFLPASLERDPAARTRLLAEVRNARSVSHPNVCRVYDVGEVAGRSFLTMEYIDGEDLASLLKRVGRLSPPKALEVARQLVAGLAAAHDKGLLHRDLKPANVMLDGQGRARLTDFGLSVEAAPGKSPGDFAGTVAYMAPERFEGKPATVRSDLYSLGLILYETCTGKAALRSTTVEGWRRAHSDSQPTAPSAVVAEIDRALERAILWCLEKDPAKRPASAAQLAAALPGGDPLAAMIAAGETPSPELVAASGEEGTLPRAKAWLWLAACLVALAGIPFTWMPFNLTEHVAFDLGPEALQARARDVLQRFGYADPPADRSWWFRTDEDYLERVNRLRSGEAAADLRTARPGPLLFCYRQSPASLIPATGTGVTTAVEPPPQVGDVYVELDLGGRLVALRVEPPEHGSAQPSSRVDWAPLFDAAQLGPPDAFVQAAPQWWPESAPDVRDAREGVYAGRQVRVEAAARAGRPIFFRLQMPWTTASRSGAAGPSSTSNAFTQATLAGFWASLLVLAVLARRNLRLGRSDRAAARTLAVAVFIAWAARSMALTHSLLGSLDYYQGRPGPLVQPLLFGLYAWIAYVGLEPLVRRTWPHVLITSTRLLAGQWRDPLVGRAMLAGVLVGLIYALPGSLWICRWLDLPGGGPTVFPPGSLNDAWFFAGTEIEGVVTGLLDTLFALTVLLVARLVVRRAGAAWVITAVMMVSFNYLGLLALRPATISPWLLLAMAAVFSLLLVWVFWKHGALAFAVAFVAGGLTQNALWTLDLSRWYAWRQWVVVAAIVALAAWGFRNVLGKQSLFPALEEE